MAPSRSLRSGVLGACGPSPRNAMGLPVCRVMGRGRGHAHVGWQRTRTQAAHEARHPSGGGHNRADPWRELIARESQPPVQPRWLEPVVLKGIYFAGKAGPHNKELKLTKPSIMKLRSLTLCWTDHARSARVLTETP